MHTDYWTLQSAATAFAYVMTLGFLVLFLVVIFKIATDKIDIGSVIMEKDGSQKASISRFQLLIFTLTIAGLYVVLSVEAGTLIDVPNGALALLGISGASFLISKGVGTTEGRMAEKRAAHAPQGSRSPTPIQPAHPLQPAAAVPAPDAAPDLRPPP